MTDAQPVRYLVRATAKNEAIGKNFVHWMLTEHGDDLLGVPGCLEYRVFKLSSCMFSCEYLFASQEALNLYYDKFADEMRARGRAKFSADDVAFSREESILIGQNKTI